MHSKIGKPLHGHLCNALSFLLVTVLLLLSTPVFADNILEVYKKLEKELPKEDSPHYGEWVNRFKEAGKFFKFLSTKDEELNRFNISVGAGFKGDRAGEKELFKLDIESEISKGIYPNEFRFKAGATTQLKNDTLQEDVTRLMVNYDHHFKPWLQVYGFVERFSNSYLSIQQRYETGGGISFELDLLNTTKKINNELDTIGNKSEKDYKKYRNIYENMTEKVYKKFRDYLDNLDDSPPHKKLMIDTKLLRSKLEDLEKEEKRIKQAFKKKHAKLSVGLAMTLFSELERAKIEAFFDEIKEENGEQVIQEATEPTPILLDEEQKFRFVLRPSVVIRPTDDLTLMGYKYFKCPLGSPYKNGGKRDYRTDALIRAELVLKKDAGWANKVSLIIEYQRHYDNSPPRLPQSIIDDYENAVKILRGEGIAENTHEEFKFALKISF